MAQDLVLYWNYGKLVDVWKHNLMPVQFTREIWVQNFSHFDALFIIWSIVKTHGHNNKTSSLVDSKFLWCLSWSPCELCDVFTWPLSDSLVIATWFSGDFYLIPLPLSQPIVFKNCYINSYFQYFSIEALAIKQFPLNNLAKGLCIRIVQVHPWSW